MNSNDIVLHVIRDHTNYCFKSIDILFKSFTVDDFEKKINGFPIWQQFYHMLNSIDRILTDPPDGICQYSKPFISEKTLS
ncbi:MAG TPA: hypothetical protein PLR39_09150 [Treponemataceae bacterium]|nr:hypothetical protein [Treponemataceae bacterium]